MRLKTEMIAQTPSSPWLIKEYHLICGFIHVFTYGVDPGHATKTEECPTWSGMCLFYWALLKGPFFGSAWFPEI